MNEFEVEDGKERGEYSVKRDKMEKGIGTKMKKGRIV